MVYCFITIELINETIDLINQTIDLINEAIDHDYNNRL